MKEEERITFQFFPLQIRKSGHFPMPELKLSISFPNLTSDGYPVLYPSGWSSTEVSHAALQLCQSLLSFSVESEAFCPTGHL